MKTKWIYCPICGNKTRVKLRYDSVLKNFPLYCPKCKKESLISAAKMKVNLIKQE
ncbi:MAG: cysteine-rich KTR domain-containing protein, partial [Acutalibacter sp.]|nr:cysteine-rich KTR domain-containing protein [Acutalibacter sp.]